MTLLAHLLFALTLLLGAAAPLHLETEDEHEHETDTDPEHETESETETDTEHESEPDGHALATYDSTGNERSHELLGTYGAQLPGLSRGGTWAIQGFHGTDHDRREHLAPMGARHMTTRGDGLWLQPEPLLYLGMTHGDLGHPLLYGGVYAAGNPWGLEDREGRYPTLLFAAAAQATGHGADPGAAASDPAFWATAGGMAAAGTAVWAAGGAAVAAGSAFAADVNALGITGAALHNAAMLNKGAIAAGEEIMASMVGADVTPDLGDVAPVALRASKGPALPDSAWQKNAPKQVEPGTKSIVHKKGDETSFVEYDDYGRQKARTDYTDHGRPKDHTDPHHHTTEYGPGKKDGHQSGPQEGPAPGHPEEPP